MTPVTRISWVVAGLILLQGIALAEPPAQDEKSREDDIFGEEPAAPPAGLPPAQAATESDLGDARMTGPARENTELLSRDRTQIGGFFYTRNGASLGQGSKISDMGLSNTTLFDTYFDSRVNDRVRAYARARIIYNPLADAPASSGLGGLGFGNGSGEEVRYVVDQLWLKFDVLQHVFVTVGRQHVRWGATRIWNPVDVINPTKYNPLLFFDERTGVPMVKVHVPFNNERWNAYLLVLNDNATTLDRLGAAARVETVFGQAEFGFSGKVQKGSDPKLGLDLSAGLGDIDLTAELGSVFPVAGDPTWLASAGVSYTYAYREDDSLTVAVEYFHNPEGHTFEQVKSKYDTSFTDYAMHATDPNAKLTLPALTPFYTGRDYAALLAAIASPGSWSDTSITLLALSNLSDQSGLGRLSLSSLFLTDLTVEAFVSASWGDGELRGYVPMLKDKLTTALPAVEAFDVQKATELRQVRDSLHAPLLGAGLNLRVNL